MKKNLLVSLILLLALATSAMAQGAAPSLKLPPYKKVKLKNGMTLLLVERHTVPLIGFQAIVKTGAVADAAGKEGTASMTSSLLRKGTKTRTADQFTSELDFIGAQFNAASSTDGSPVSIQFVKKDLDKALDLFADALMNPSFPQAEFAKLQKQRLDGLKTVKDQAQAVIGNYFNTYFFGSHPYGRPADGDEKSIAALTRDDVVKFHESFYTPGNTILAVAGDFNTADMEKLLAQKFDGWAAHASPAVIIPPTTAFTGKKLLLVDKPDSTQTYFRIGNLGIARTNADRVYLRVVNTLFGGRFTSMINSELRIKTGLTYGADSFFDERKSAGPFEIASYTKNATTVEALDKTLEVLKQLHEKGVTEEQLKSAKNYIQGQFPPTLETASQLAAMLVDLEFYGLDEHEINDLYAKINSMTLADAQRVIKQYYPMDSLVFVLIGKSSEISDAVKKYAPKVDTLKISDPGFGK
ncbi:MAG TPA: pitrilysin family protein [Candidatus Angelobacter sp.]|nr:pitrilysin family protein [Candidatus Angelobacter sp.]